MSIAPERDKNGRFVKTAIDNPSSEADGVEHPFSRFLFGWVEHKRTPSLLLSVVVILSVGLFILDFMLDRHDYFPLAEANGFYAFWGFCAFALAVLAGWPLGYLLRRDENYYGESETRPADTEAEE